MLAIKANVLWTGVQRNKVMEQRGNSSSKWFRAYWKWNILLWQQRSIDTEGDLQVKSTQLYLDVVVGVVAKKYSARMHIVQLNCRFKKKKKKT